MRMNLQQGPLQTDCRDAAVHCHRHCDNYYGYCKKEVKTQISYVRISLACARRNTRRRHCVLRLRDWPGILRRRTVLTKQVIFEDAMKYLVTASISRPERYAVDRNYPNVSMFRRTPIFWW